MTFLSSIAVALSALRANKLRSLLTMLGVIIGVGSVVTMVSVSDGASARVESVINSLGTSTLMVWPSSRKSGGRHSGAGSARQFNDKDIKAIKTGINGIAAISGEVSGSAQIVAGGTNWFASVNGVNADYMKIKDHSLLAGRFFNDREEKASMKVALLGTTVAKELFPDMQAAVGQTIRVNKVPFTVIGVLAPKGQSSWGRDRDDVVVLPLNAARKRVVGKGSGQPNQIRMLHIKVDEAYNMKQVEEEIGDMLRLKRKVKPGDADNFRIMNMAEMVKARSDTQSTLSQLLAITAAVSLIVGGIGIMNIMLVSVTERTKEIGLRLAVGARKRDIMTQFLIEAIALSILGGLIGLTLGAGIAYYMASQGDWPILISTQVVAMALGSAVIVGVFFGFYPAKTAAELNPIDALRYE